MYLISVPLQANSTAETATSTAPVVEEFVFTEKLGSRLADQCSDLRRAMDCGQKRPPLISPTTPSSAQQVNTHRESSRVHHPPSRRCRCLLPRPAAGAGRHRARTARRRADTGWHPEGADC